MTNQPSRLDQIEDLLLQTATNLNQVTIKLDRVAEQQTINTQSIGNLTVKVDQLTTKIDNLTADVASLTEITMHDIQHAEDDREAWQAEIRRIWEYLRDRNGGSAAA
ncbi:hypothetical protein H6G54_28520 [Anabaena cylindrica FACHB-243]|uniref:Uncharacterized protein n=1 Tax=Anabaena cylindrica (strain ATCC 27899 / PCC 7122) TaxID=272123 RepID=K9ZSC0_ANACC|nr:MULTISPECIES: hypothetical protein [Anabaena]AFZ61432.1 hypothetical protein Anacy_6163 [Anabaena cylindrica PCC 7122]MBD2421552.1 hypothetical protein [Anabaena cylindrica FACHB-243]MBY5284251.1 hypothetical protein [Anabaena sp. CCAP 1446/1C]MBY5310622.1 hypothetical protein [Anabaena sp. CCAP 1446/1C]MCM2405967.1 hypothetical protein [Anabaena sp. CCAP 1446/1C]